MQYIRLPKARAAATPLAPMMSLMACAVTPLLYGQAAAAPSGTSLPPPIATLAAVDLDTLLYLELVINRKASGKVVPVVQRGGSYLVDADRLRALGVTLENVSPAIGTNKIVVDLLSGAQVQYDVAHQRLLIDLPPSWLPSQELGGLRAPRQPAFTSTGLMLNYDVFASAPEHGRTAVSAWNELRFFSERGVFSNTGILRRGTDQYSGYTRYDTRWSYADEERMLTWELGDVVTRGTSWSSAVRMGGLQVSRDFSLRPDLVKYPLPRFAGEAAIPGAVDLFIDGYRASHETVNPGPFVLSNAPFINGAGEAVIVVTDATGNQVTTSVPFYVSSSLLRSGLTDFAAGVGSMRRGYGLQNSSYGGLATHGTVRHGLTDWLTLEAHGEAARSFALTGVGGVMRLGNAGILNLAVGASRNNGTSGTQSTLGYQYSARRWNIAMQHNRRSDQFTDLALRERPDSLLAKRSSTTISGSVSLGGGMSLGAGWFDVQSAQSERTRLLNLSLGMSPWRNTQMYLSANREVGTGKWSAALQLVYTFDGNHGSVSTGVERNSDGSDSQRVQYSRSAPMQGGLGWNVAASRTGQGDAYHQADLNWRDEHLQLRGGLYGTSGNMTRWGGASGALVMMDGSVFASNQIRDAFVVVDTNGHADIPVRYENQIVGTTGSDGRLLVPWGSAYYSAKYEIDPMQLPANVETPLVEQRAAVRRGGGYLLSFPVNRVVAASVTLHGPEGRALPVGSQVTQDDDREAVVGWDGLVYLEGLKANNHLSVRLPDGRSCQADFALNVEQDAVANIGPLVCR